jgi:hypothetical protein
VLVLICAILGFFAVLGGVFFFVKKIADKNAETSIVLRTLDDQIKEKENRTLLEKKVAEAKAIHSKISAYLVDANTIDTFVDTIEALGHDTKTDVAVTNVIPLPGSANSLSIKVSAKGQFADIVKMFSLLENLPYAIDIKSVYLNQDVLSPAKVDSKSRVPWQIDIMFTVTHT